MVRRILVVLNVIFLTDYPNLQIFLFMGQQLAYTLYLFRLRPYEEPKMNRIEMFNELMLLLTSESLLIFTQYVDDPIAQYNFGWYPTGLMLSTVMINTLISTYD